MQGYYSNTTKVKHETWRYACGMFSEKQIAVFDAKAGLLLCDTENGRREYLGRFPNITGFSELRLYCCDPYICVVENRGINGAVVNTLTGKAIELVRGNYHVEHCSYPIGFVRREGEWLLIHGTDWNRLDIMRLSDFTNLTERASTKENTDDYFHDLVAVSPQGTRFASNGWVWSPMDSIQVYELERHIHENDKTFIAIEPSLYSSGYNWGRPLCWIDENMLAVGRNPNEGMGSYISGEGDENAKPYVPSTIEIYDVTRITEKPYRFEDENGQATFEGVSKYHPLTETIEFDGFGCDLANSEVYGDLYYDSDTKVFIGMNGDTGLLISRHNGEVLVKENSLKEYNYSPEFRCFYKYAYKDNKLEVIRLDTLVGTKPN